MRLTLSTFLYVLSFLFYSGAEGRATDERGITRGVPQHNDTCAYVESPLSLLFSSLSGTNSSCSSGDDVLIHACLCTAEVEAFIKFSGLAIGDLNSTELELAAEKYIVKSPGAKQCSYPPNSTPRCSRDDPCGYECSNGFRRRSYRLWGETRSTCTCPLPNTVCGGQCGSFPDGCPKSNATPEGALRATSGPSPSAGFASASPTGSLYSSQTQQSQDAGCAPQETLCGAYAPRGRVAAECVDTRSSLESCGGCRVPPPSLFLRHDDESQYKKRQLANGVDCTAIEAATDVSCSAGRCLVQACEVGWVVAPSGDHCVPNRSSNAAFPEENFGGRWYAPASMPHLQLVPSTTDSPTSATPDPATSTETTPPESNEDAPSTRTSSDFAGSDSTSTENAFTSSTSSSFASPNPTSPPEDAPTSSAPVPGSPSEPVSPSPGSGGPAVASTDANNDQTTESDAAPNSNSGPGADSNAGGESGSIASGPGNGPEVAGDQGDESGPRGRLGRFQGGFSDDGGNASACGSRQRRDFNATVDVCATASLLLNATGTNTSTPLNVVGLAGASASAGISGSGLPSGAGTGGGSGLQNVTSASNSTLSGALRLATVNSTGGASSCGSQRRGLGANATGCVSVSVAGNGNETSILGNLSSPNSTNATALLNNVTSLAGANASAILGSGVSSGTGAGEGSGPQNVSGALNTTLSGAAAAVNQNSTGGTTSCGNQRRDLGANATGCVSVSVAGNNNAANILENPSSPNSANTTTLLNNAAVRVGVSTSARVTGSGLPSGAGTGGGNGLQNVSGALNSTLSGASAATNSTGNTSSCGQRRDLGGNATVCASASVAGNGDATRILENLRSPNSLSTNATTLLNNATSLAGANASAILGGGASSGTGAGEGSGPQNVSGALNSTLSGVVAAVNQNSTGGTSSCGSQRRDLGATAVVCASASVAGGVNVTGILENPTSTETTTLPNITVGLVAGVGVSAAAGVTDSGASTSTSTSVPTSAFGAEVSSASNPSPVVSTI